MFVSLVQWVEYWTPNPRDVGAKPIADKFFIIKKLIIKKYYIISEDLLPYF